MLDRLHNKTRLLTLLFAGFAWLLTPWMVLAQPVTPTSSGPEPMDNCQVLARIGKQVVLSCEIMWRVNLLIEQNRDRIPASEIEEARKHLLKQNLNSVLDTKLLYADFRSRVPLANVDQIHQSLNKPFEEEHISLVMKQVGVEKRSELPARLIELGGSMQDLRQDFYQTQIAQSWARESIKINREVTHEQLLEYYHENGEQYDQPARARWEELMVRFSRFDDRNAAWQAIAAMGNQAFGAAAQVPDASKPVFAEIAKAGSHGFTAEEGGVHSWTTKGALAASKIDSALFELPLGQMSPILKSELGFHIVRVLERKEAGRQPFSEVQSEIENKIRGRRFNKAVQAKLKELRENTQIWTVYGGTTTAQAYLESQRGARVRR